MPARLWLDLTTQDFGTRDMSRAIAVLPVGAVEQHGPHLPVGVDTHIAEGYLARLMRLVPDDLDVLVLPVQTVGKSNEHLAFPGTLAVSAETLIRAWFEIGESVLRAGCRKLVFVNSHGGNVAVIDIVARELRVKLGLLVVPAGIAWAIPTGCLRKTSCATASTRAMSRPRSCWPSARTRCAATGPRTSSRARSPWSGSLRICALCSRRGSAGWPRISIPRAPWATPRRPPARKGKRPPTTAPDASSSSCATSTASR